jgi:hypothetical protein
MTDPYCFVLEDGKTHRRELELGIDESEMIEVLSGLSPGELVVDLGKENVDDGIEVELIVEETASE